jgi:hypothetical protein
MFAPRASNSLQQVHALNKTKPFVSGRKHSQKICPKLHHCNDAHLTADVNFCETPIFSRAPGNALDGGEAAPRAPTTMNQSRTCDGPNCLKGKFRAAIFFGTLMP